MEDNIKSDNILLALAVIAVFASIVATGFTYFSIANLFSTITGHPTAGEANLTVETTIQINFTTFSVSFGSGRVNPNSVSANLFTVGSGTVTGGNWTADSGLIIENIGNVNVSLNLTGGKTAAQFIGGTAPIYMWNISNVEANSCVNGTATTSGEVKLNLNTFHNVNTSVGNARYCPTLRFDSTGDQIRIDFNITVPEDSLTGALGDVITATVYT